MKAKLQANETMSAALEARWAELEKQLAEENRARSERAAAASARAAQPRPTPAQPTLRVVAPVAPQDPALGERKPRIVWSADVPVVFPHPAEAYAGRRRELIDAALRAIRRRASDKPGQARRLATKLEETLGVTVEDGRIAWSPILALVESLGSPTAAQDLAALAGKRRWRDKPLPLPGQRKEPKAPKKQDAKFSDGPTPERRVKSIFSEEVVTSVSTEQRTGERAWNEDALPAPKATVIGRAMREKGNDAATRLARFRMLDSEHIRAGVRFATDWEKAQLEPKVTVNLLATGGGSSASAWASGKSLGAMQARDRVHLAVQALNLGGLEVVHVVEAVVVCGETAVRAASATYGDNPRASAHVAATLKIGLNLLARHYKMADAKGAQKRAAKEIA